MLNNFPIKRFGAERGRYGCGEERPPQGESLSIYRGSYHFIPISKHVRHTAKKSTQSWKSVAFLLQMLPVNPPYIPNAFAIADEKGLAVTPLAASDISINPMQIRRSTSTLERQTRIP
jgi:hypothetical protein